MFCVGVSPMKWTTTTEVREGDGIIEFEQTSDAWLLNFSQSGCHLLGLPQHCLPMYQHTEFNLLYTEVTKLPKRIYKRTIVYVLNLCGMCLKGWLSHLYCQIAPCFASFQEGLNA